MICCDMDGTNVKGYSYLTSKIDSIYHEAAWKCGLSDSAMRILYVICLHGEECRLSEIILLSGISKQTANSALRKLENEGVLDLEPDRGRAKKVVLTEKGKRLAENTALKILQIENRVFGSWTKEEREQYFLLTQKYLSSFKEKMEEAGL
jgi:DNA-binding MarR family transcriptional regulator